MKNLSENTSSSLPEGTVTFLFTDIEGSTELLRKLGEEYMTLLADHHQILRTTFTKWNGREVGTEGDAFFVSFPRASDAVSGVVEAQRALAERAWSQGVTVRVRMGLHTGEPWTAQEGYVGMDVHRAARIAHVGHGGQVLLSGTTTSLVVDQLPDGVSLLDLGQHRLKDIHRPELIHQLVIDGLPSEFASLKSLGLVEPAENLISKSARLPVFLKEVKSQPRPAFVGREMELGRLNDLLAKALDGQGQAAFLSGDAGSGKSSLLGAFTAQAGEEREDLLVSWGICNAFSGSGDPYLPFRKILSAFTGDVEAVWASGAITTEEARAAWLAMPSAVEALLAEGPDLLDVLVPTRSLLTRMESAFPAGYPSRTALEERAAHRTPSEDLARAQLFEQTANTVRRISENQPVVIILDDLQWADRGSLDLLFHLGRSLAGARILLLLAYRPDEVTADREHPLRPLLEEFRRSLGDVWLDLNQSPGRSFVDAFIDNEANHLEENFREVLFERTAGHPLFTVELLRNMQERGNLVKDQSGAWVVGPSLDWEALPVRVEGAIEARIGRLEEELRDILTVASVEGGTFTAQVVARVEEIQERQLIRILSRELEKRHKLVHEDQTEQIGQQLISRYRFVHQMFQRYLYNDLPAAERRMLHGEVGELLEELYDTKSSEIVVQLARHFVAAGDKKKAAEYMLLAGDHARLLYAHKEAIEYYQQALLILKEQDEFERASRTLMKLGLTYHNTSQYELARQAHREGAKLWQLAATVETTAVSEATYPLKLAWLDPEFLDPSVRNVSSVAVIIENLFSGLLARAADMSVVPDMAHSWDLLDGGRKYLFHLREDVRWSDNQPVTARDFEFAWKRLLHPATKSLNAILGYDLKGASAYHQGQISDPDTIGVRALDSHTLEVELEEPTAYFLYLMAGTAAFPVPEHVVERYGVNWAEAEHIVTNGPFMVQEWKTGREMVFVPNPTYHGRRRGNVQRIGVTLLPDTQRPADLGRYESEHLDFLGIRSPSEPERVRIRRQHAGDYGRSPEPVTDFLVLDESTPPFADRRVRQALAMAIDKNELANVLLKGLGLPATGGLIPPSIPGYSESIGLPFDPARARSLLAEAGYPGGDGFPQRTAIYYRRSRQPVRSFLSDQWIQVLGIEFKWKNLDYAGIRKIFWERGQRWPSGLYGWAADYPDPDSFMRSNTLIANTMMRTNDEYVRLVEDARQILDNERRMQLYGKADRLLVEEAQIIPLIYQEMQWLVRPWVHNYGVSSDELTGWKDIIVDPH